MGFKITYSVLDADMAEIDREFEETLARLKKGLGKEYPLQLGGKEMKTGKFIESKNPARKNEVLAKFHALTETELDQVFKTSSQAQKKWGHTPWQERVKLIRKAADLISERRMEIAAIMTLEVGKNRLESLGDAEESADLLRYYASQLEESNGFLKPMSKLSPNENAISVLRPYGVFTVISPFNFPMALSAGMSSAALLGGNTVVMKPSSETPWTGQKLYECYRDAGIPEGVFQLVHCRETDLGDVMLTHPLVAGLAFTGSKEVGMKLSKKLSTRYPKPALMELGGKNAAIICAKANLDDAAHGCARSAFGLTGQKCSALSRVYVHESVKEEFLKKLVEKTKALVIGNPEKKESYVGPIINQKAMDRHFKALAEAKREGKVIYGGEDLSHNPELAEGYYVQPVIAELPRGHHLFQDELFSPFLAVDTFSSLEEAVREASHSDYGLTAGIYSQSKEDVEYFMEHMEAGVLYANRKTGATTGAWPGVQAFCGWKGSGATGKGGCGPYYASQFMREQSQTRME